MSLKVVTGRWRALVVANPQLGAGEIDRRAYSFCVLEALVAALDRRDVFVTRSGRFTDPRAKLLSGPAWTATRPDICAGLNLDPDPRQALERLGRQLDSAYQQTAERLPQNVALQIAEIAGADRPDLSKLEALDEPEQLSTLRTTTTAMLPARVAFSEVLLEACRWSRFADAFTHLSEDLARAEDLNVSICAVLLAEACNISLTEVANPGIPALSLALNALVLWNAQYLDDAITQLRATGHEITDEDLRRLSPLLHEHIKMLGHFPFTLPHDLAAGARRQLRELSQAA